MLVPKKDGLLGKMVEVEIIETGKHFLKASLLGDMYTPSIAEPLPKGKVSGAPEQVRNGQNLTRNYLVRIFEFQ